MVVVLYIDGLIWCRDQPGERRRGIKKYGQCENGEQRCSNLCKYRYVVLKFSGQDHNKFDGKIRELILCDTCTEVLPDWDD